MKIILLGFMITVLIIKSKAKLIDSFLESVHSKIGNNVRVIFSPNISTSYNISLESMAKIVGYSDFNRNIPTIIYIHGFLGNGDSDESARSLRKAFRLNKQENFISVDWSDYSKIKFGLPYFDNIPGLKIICKKIADQLKLIQKETFYEKFYLVGHSLGGQCAGLIGRHLQEITNNKFVIPRIYALDPAGPYFKRQNIHFECIRKSDAAYVQVIHTNAAMYGLDKAIGHSDFFPNGGWVQPGCYTNVCSHKFAWMIFHESVIEEGSFVARKCNSSNDFLIGKCELNEISFMGYSRNSKLPMGKFYLSTHPSGYASALGFKGIDLKEFKKTFEQFLQRAVSGAFNFFYILIDGVKSIFDFIFNLDVQSFEQLLKNRFESYFATFTKFKFINS